MRTCPNCAGRLKRVHRTLLERFSYLAIYECGVCRREEYVPRRYKYHFGPECRCPKCGTLRVSRLEKPDKIDPMHTGPWNWFERMSGGSLHWCCFCRVQFYDRRKPAPRLPAADAKAATTQRATG